MTITVIHTTPSTIPVLGALIREKLPQARLINLLDDSILPDLLQERAPEAVRDRWLQYARIAAQNGADAVLSACSSVGDYADEAAALLPIPVYRIDEAMAAEAVRRGGTILVFATVETTLAPTVRLLRRLAEASGNDCTIKTRLVSGAYDLLCAGDAAGHNRKIMEAVQAEKDGATSIVLAQASMAAALTEADAETASKILTSPVLGIEKLARDLGQS